ncbi:MAG: hypothetical protein ABIP76_02465 [Verrucomicrobiota bacterium]
MPEIGNTLISANAHATFAMVEQSQKYLQSNSNPAKQIELAGVIAYIHCKNWEDEIRLVIDKSLAFPAGLFLTWSTAYGGSKPSREVLKKVKEAFEESVTKFDLTFPKND